MTPGRRRWTGLVPLVRGAMVAVLATVWGAGAGLPGEALPAPAKARLPRLVDVGAGTCIPCKMMAPVLDQLKKEQAGKIEVVVLDITKDRKAGERYGIQVIPTQVFYDAAGKEFYRHQGFFPKKKILQAFRKRGIPLAEGKGSK